MKNTGIVTGGDRTQVNECQLCGALVEKRTGINLPTERASSVRLVCDSCAEKHGKPAAKRMGRDYITPEQTRLLAAVPQLRNALGYAFDFLSKVKDGSFDPRDIDGLQHTLLAALDKTSPAEEVAF